jgi:rhodanese-related sulfurtransferase
MSEPNRFQRLVAEAKKNIREIPPAQLPEQLSKPGALLLDVREPDDFKAGHAAGAIHLGRGVIETEIEDVAPDLDTPIVCYCGGGSRSSLVTESLQRMGYTNVRSLAGGFRAYKAAGMNVEGGKAT